VDSAATLEIPKKSSSRSMDAVPIDHIYVTHCLYGEGIYRQAGFAVRACSTRDPLLLRFAQEYPFYRAPLGMRGSRPESAPRHLALVRIPGGRSALIHSVDFPDDDRGRPNNFFSHVLVHPGLTACEALTTWASPDWTVSYDAGAAKNLEPVPCLPSPGPVNDSAVSAYLQPIVLEPDSDLATLIFPQRLSGDLQKRRELLSLTLRGCLLALRAGPSSPRGRFYLHAEPGFAALLFYAVARLLPEALAANLTFSTYENAQRDLRTYKHAQMVGTYLADPGKGLDDEFYTTRGYSLDTFNSRFSPELEEEGELPLDEWFDMAAKGDWTTVDKVHRLQGKMDTSLVSFREAFQAAKLGKLMASGQARAEDLIALKHSSCGPAILERHRAKVWPLVRDGSLADPRLREEFAELLQEHLPELELQTAEAMGEKPAANWQPHWKLVCAILHQDPARLRDTFQRILPEPPYPPDLRFSLLQELRRLQLSSLDQRLPLNALLRDCSPEELDQLALSDLPREWLVLALCHAMSRSATRADAVQRVHGGDDALIRAYWEQFKLLKDEAQRRAILSRLFPADDPRSDPFLSRLLKSGCFLRAETLEWLLDSLDAFTPKKAEFWDRDNHLGHLLEMLRNLGESAEPIWNRLCEQITSEVLLQTDAHQNALLLALAAANDRPGPSVPLKAAQVIADWVLLREHFEKAAGVAPDGRASILDACKRRGLDSIEVLTRYFERFIQPRGLNHEVLVDFVGFFHSFYLEGAEYQDHGSRLLAWLQIVDGCMDESQRADYQRFYLAGFVPVEFRRRLAEETAQVGALLPAVLESIPKTTQGGAAEEVSRDFAASGISENLFQWTGIRPAEAPPSFSVSSLWRRLPWLLCTMGGGLLAAWATGFFRFNAAAFAAVAPFIPVVVGLAESMALQSAGLAASGARGRWTLSRKAPRSMEQELLAGVLLGVMGGIIAGGAAIALTRTLALALSLGLAVVGGMVGAAVIGTAVPLLIVRLGWSTRVAAGPLVRALASTLALLAYFGLARWLVP